MYGTQDSYSQSPRVECGSLSLTHTQWCYQNAGVGLGCLSCHKRRSPQSHHRRRAAVRCESGKGVGVFDRFVRKAQPSDTQTSHKTTAWELGPRRAMATSWQTCCTMQGAPQNLHRQQGSGTLAHLCRKLLDLLDRSGCPLLESPVKEMGRPRDECVFQAHVAAVHSRDTASTEHASKMNTRRQEDVEKCGGRRCSVAVEDVHFAMQALVHVDCGLHCLDITDRRPLLALLLCPADSGDHAKREVSLGERAQSNASFNLRDSMASGSTGLPQQSARSAS